MDLCIEYGCSSLNKYGEELCGDQVELCQNDEWTTLVLADGLGSGVKASILSTLTSKLLCKMIANDIDIIDCIETIIQTLPVCKVRRLAYSTFSVIHVNRQGEGCLFEFDNPQAIWYHDGHSRDFAREEMLIRGKKVYKSNLQLRKNDLVILMSDGTVHAGVGKILNFGWTRPQIMEHLDRTIRPGMSARAVACMLASACNDLYLDKPGDDTTVAAIRIREPLQVNIMVGPPVDRDSDNYYVTSFMHEEGKKIVCGGTTAQIVARQIGKPLETSFDFPDKDVPPIGFIEGIDLATEGVLTMRRLLELSDRYLSISDLTPKTFHRKDGASRLASILFEEATSIVFYIGQSVNKAHKGLEIDTTMKLKLVEHLAANLRAMGKKVTLYYD